MSLRHSESGPFFADFRPERNPVPWTCCCLAAKSGDGALSFEHFGTAYGTVFGLEEADARLADDPASRFAHLFGSFTEALKGGRPLRKEGPCADGRRAFLYRSVLLPFVDPRGSPAYVLGAFSASVS
jgi:hypothetical protein